MKTIKIGILLAVTFFGAAPFSHAVDIESVNSYLLIDRLLSLPGPGAPEIFDDLVIFTASSSLQKVGIAFADEGFAKIHWFRQLLVSRDPAEIPKKKTNPPVSPYVDTGIIFYVHQIPEGASEVEYRLIINGLWTTDPANPESRRNNSGLSWSTIAVPPGAPAPGPLKGPPGSLSFSFRGPPGETVSVAGSFNGWDPFMYELKEGPAGNYTINIPLPPGRYQYVFFHRGQRHLDPYNTNRVYSKDGKAASEIVLY
ncbi:MAG: glycogen-binding domain-containing protein [Treponema sp.]|nr:glycogen-binding domain-containing protein [Treponema sp.]